MMNVRATATRVAFCMKPSTRIGQPALGLAAAPLRGSRVARQGKATTARIVRVRVRHHARVEAERSRLGLLRRHARPHAHLTPRKRRARAACWQNSVKFNV